MLSRRGPDLSAFACSVHTLDLAGKALTRAVARQLAMPKPDDEPLDTVAFYLGKVERLSGQAAWLIEVAGGQGGAALVAREALRRRLKALGVAAQALAEDAQGLAMRD
jgi:hypothetical protein